MMDKECKDCDYYCDGACLCLPLDKWYACPIESHKPENIQALKEYANQQPNRCDSCMYSEEQDGSNCYECVKRMADNFEVRFTDTDCISRTRLLARIDAERKHLLDIKMDGAEHIIVHHARRIIEDMPSVTPSIPDVENNFDIGYNCGYADAMFDIAEGE